MAPAGRQGRIYLARFQTNSSVPPTDGAGLMNFSSSAVKQVTRPLLIGSDQVRKRTPLNLSGDDLIPLVDRVCAEVSDRSLHHGLAFLRSPLIAPVGRELGEVGACVHQRKVTVSLFCA